MSKKQEELNCMNCRIMAFKDNLCDCDNGFCARYKGIGNEKDFFKAILEDVRPKGKWIEGEVESYLLGVIPYHRYICSECGYHFSNKRGAKNPCYCQDCGADMRGGQDND